MTALRMRYDDSTEDDDQTFNFLLGSLDIDHEASSINRGFSAQLVHCLVIVLFLSIPITYKILYDQNSLVFDDMTQVLL